MDQLDGKRVLRAGQRSAEKWLAALASVCWVRRLVLERLHTRGRQKKTQPPPPDVGVAKVMSKPVRQWDEFTGRIAAVEAVEFAPVLSGYVERVAYKEGQEINKGDLLFVIDERRCSGPSSRAAQAELERARSAAQLAQVQGAPAHKPCWPAMPSPATRRTPARRPSRKATRS